MKTLIQAIVFISAIFSLENATAQRAPTDSELVSIMLRDKDWDSTNRYSKLIKEIDSLTYELKYLEEHYPEKSRSEDMRKEIGRITGERNRLQVEANYLSGSAQASLKNSRIRNEYYNKFLNRRASSDYGYSGTTVDYKVKKVKGLVTEIIGSDGQVYKNQKSLRVTLAMLGLTMLGIHESASASTQPASEPNVEKSMSPQNVSKSNLKSKDWANSAEAGELGAH